MTMVRMSDVWDRTTEVLRGRASMLATIAALLVFLPAVAQGAAQLFLTAGLTGVSAILVAAFGFLVVVLLVAVVRLWGSASIVSAGSDPTYDRAAAMSHGARRLPAMIGVSALLGLAVVALLLPFFLVLGTSINWVALAHGQAPDLASLPPLGAIVGAMFYLFILVFVLLFVFIRLLLLVPVIVNERLGVGAIGRAWRLTRGLFWRIFGVLFLFGLVFAIASSAATLLLGLVARLLLGGSHVAVATFIGQLGTAAVAAGYAVVTGVFTAQLYRMLTGREAAETFA